MLVYHTSVHTEIQLGDLTSPLYGVNFGCLCLVEWGSQPVLHVAFPGGIAYPEHSTTKPLRHLDMRWLSGPIPAARQAVPAVVSLMTTKPEIDHPSAPHEICRL